MNAAGAAAVGRFASHVLLAVAGMPGLKVEADPAGPSPRGDRRSFNASLGTIPNYVGPGDGKKGVLLDGVRPGGAAEKAGLQRGDILVKLGAHEVGSVEDLMFVLNASKPGETVPATVVREGRELVVEVTFQESARPR